MVQRPDLFGAVVCRVPVADMLRYHRFTVGRFWISEYGSADDPVAVSATSIKYSPLHNVRDGVSYPPILITTADTDDRVSPGMAKKFAARLQAAGHDAPVLIRVETKAGHGAGQTGVEDDRRGRGHLRVPVQAPPDRIASRCRHRWIRAEPPFAKARTCSSVAIVVSPGTSRSARRAPSRDARACSGDSPVSKP